MKNIAENSEVFMAYARIDYCYYILKELSQPKKSSQIEAAIDNVTGYGLAMEKEKIKTTKAMLVEIISSKKIIEADYSGEEKALNALKKIISKKS